MTDIKTETAVKAKKTVAASKTATTKKAPASKAAAPKAAPKTPTRSAPARKSAAGTKISAGVTPEQRYKMICDAAYFKAQSRGFAPENEIQDWLDAEAEIDSQLLAGL